MENKELFGRLMDLWAAHTNSYEESRTLYDAVHDFANSIYIHDKLVYSTRQSAKAKELVNNWANTTERIYYELFVDCTGLILKKDGYLLEEDPSNMIDGDTISGIIEDYAKHLRKNNLLEDSEYKEKVWEQLQKDTREFI